MKKTVMALLSIPFLVTMLILGMSPEASADGAKEVVIINCTLSPPGPVLKDGYEVALSSNSAGAPVVSSGTECAQAVADVLSAGFKLKTVKGTSSFDLNYILVKK